MMRIKTFTAFLLLSFVSLCLRAYEQRDLLQKAATFEEVKEALVMDQKWVTYPAYTDREGWDRFLGETKKDYIQRGENQLKYEWKVVKATDYLEFERKGRYKFTIKKL